MLDVQLLENRALNVFSEFCLLMPQRRWLQIATDKTARISLEQGTLRRNKKGRQPTMFNTSVFTIKSIKVSNEPMIAGLPWKPTFGTLLSGLVYGILTVVRQHKKEPHIQPVSPTLTRPHLLPVDVRYPWNAGSAAVPALPWELNCQRVKPANQCEQKLLGVLCRVCCAAISGTRGG